MTHNLLKKMKIIYVFIILLICNFISKLGQSLVSPFYPGFAEEKGISEDIIGYIFSAHPIGQFIASLLLGKLVNNSNRPYLMNLGIFVQSIALICFGMLNYMEDKTTIIIISMVARLFAGFGVATFMTPFYAFIPLLFPDSVESKIAMAEISTSLGYLVGPVFGSFLFGLGGFILPFFLFAGITMFLAGILPFQYKALRPSVLEQSTKPILHRSIQNDVSVLEADFQISYLTLALQYPITAAFLVNCITNCVWTYYGPTMAPYLKQQYGVEEKHSGYYLSMNALTFTVGAVIVSRIQKHQRFVMYFGLLTLGYLQFYLGPDYAFTHVEPNKWLSVFMWAAIGFVAPFPYVLAIPFTNSLLTSYYPRYPLQCANIASALFNSSLAAGEFIGPIFGGYMTQYFGYQRSCGVFGCTILVICAYFSPCMYINKLKRLKVKQKQ